MSDATAVLDRFHSTLVEEIAARRPEYLSAPFTVAEIYQNLIPYGSHRDRLGVEMNGDYEHALVRLLAGEGGFLLLDSEAALKVLRDELRSTNPDTGIYREFAALDVRLNPAITPPASEFSAAVFDEEDAAPDEPIVTASDLAPGTARPRVAATLDAAANGVAASSTAGVGTDAPEMATDDTAGASVPGTCLWCRADLPKREGLRFCPFCGTDVSFVPCSTCGREVEPEWRFCIGCGTAVGD
jgi:hypothetical protein